MYLPDLTLHEPRSLEEAADLLRQLGTRARVMAGGTDLLVDLKCGRRGGTGADDATDLVCLGRIAGLRGVQAAPAGLRIGALTTIGALERSPALSGPYTAVRDAVREMAATQVRNLATIGGNVAGGVPCADLPPVLEALSASVVLWSRQRERRVPLDEFYLGPRRTALGSGELLTHVIVPRPLARSGAAYARFALRDGNAIAVAGVAAALGLEAEGRIVWARIALNAVAPVPKLVPQADAVLAHRTLQEAVELGAEAAMAAAEPIGDLRASAEYRRELVGVLARRALRMAHARAMEGVP